MIPSATFRWRVYTTDGSIMYFGDTNVAGTNPLAGCINVGDGYAPLTRVVDKFGNEVAYRYESVLNNECRLADITWGQNASAGLPAFARVSFTWDRAPLCRNIHSGSQTDFRTGKMIVTGASMLTTVTATAFHRDCRLHRYTRGRSRSRTTRLPTTAIFNTRRYGY
jgi:hypothetical protein